jgi:hypothetical protein
MGAAAFELEPTKLYFIDGRRPIADGVLRMLRAALIVTSLAEAMPCFAQQVRVITGDIEHVYGPGAQILDDADLQARNQRAWDHVQAEKQLAIERRRVDIEEERLKLQEAAIAYGMSQNSDGMSQNWDPTAASDWWYGSGFISPAQGFGPGISFSRRFGFSPRIGFSRRIGISPRMGFSRR